MSRFLRAYLIVLMSAWVLAVPHPVQGQPLRSPRDLPTLAPIVSQVTPAVVNISVVTRSPLEDNPLFQDPFFRRFFNLPDHPRSQEQAAGSGVIVDAARGYVVTNNHVVKGAERIIVTLKDRRQLPARLVGTDPGTDIAVLQIEAQGLSALPFGDSDQLEVGDYVIAIGNPFGIGQTVTSGIVSALGRTGLTPEGYEDFIQTDASINPGNSGGALVNLRGELIGINSAIIAPSGGNVGIGLAVPSNMARAVMSQIVRFGDVRRGRLGITMTDFTPALAKEFGVPARAGAAITAVQSDSPAEKAGLRERDVIIALNGRPIRSSGALRARLGLTPVGEEIELRIARGTDVFTILTRIAAPQAFAGVQGRTLPQLPGLAAVEIERGSPLFERLQGGGLVVTAVEQGSRAWQAGFRPGDIIYAVNRQRVQTIAELQGLIGRARNGFAVSLLRGDFQVTIIVR
ncbi:MAG: Do family serine endopeptidase [Betaproteobacteria bacterium]|nr:Do family serine endopeptidase [Betaproteobacteria bacterium]MDH3437683.1 Do family serine endopeptidase [Betaproteobacteria bacterium]